VLTIKVPPENFSAALERLAGIGSLRTQDVRADDVTERVVDLESQIRTAAASVERLRSFLDTAADLEDLAALEAELLQRETDLEILRGRLRTLEDQVALATIVLVLTEATPEPGLEVLQTAFVGHDDGASCPGLDRTTVDEGTAYTLCYEVRNVGDTRLADLDVREPGLGADLGDMLVVEGDPAAPIEPGDRVVLGLETTADPATWIGPEVSARAVDANGAPLRASVEVERERVTIEVVEDTSLPGFTDAVATAWDGLQRVVGVVVFAAGIAVPFLWVPVLLGLGFWLAHHRRGEPVAIEAPAAD
ncbi:MAG: DUF4349 domain-containing protein, partial [Acidimicrobiia bacterium]|nr:DUF4349 domain-containing protein [Acidimicrobiia bacterium]